MLSIMAQGFTYADAWHMSYRDYKRYAGLASAWSIPTDEREVRSFKPTADQNDAYT